MMMMRKWLFLTVFGCAVVSAVGNSVSSLPAEDQANLLGPIGQTFALPVGGGLNVDAVTLGRAAHFYKEDKENGWLGAVSVELREDLDGNPETWDPGEVLARSEAVELLGQGSDVTANLAQPVRLRGGRVYALVVLDGRGRVATRRVGLSPAGARPGWCLFSDKKPAFEGRFDLAMRLEATADGDVSSLPAVDSANFEESCGQTFTMAQSMEVDAIEVGGAKLMGHQDDIDNKSVKLVLSEDADGDASTWGLGAEIAESTVKDLALGDGVVTRFEFPSGVRLRQGRVYVLSFANSGGGDVAVRVGLGEETSRLNGVLFDKGEPIYEDRFDLAMRLRGSSGARASMGTGSSTVRYQGLKLHLRRKR
ncbi:hypothetical protein [Sulfuriroseicoccus oceanibius]|uniref:Uncharacterized protein n=1 Tax=Sulfuriroseicoccus oceanibius TaxID=2707525 RepID=A0A6B3LAG7_9BACT|nr:hypothetical protein [Sulfuriroseicoccus oceanibius]QQL44941.1 hypothetical protein G3M56_013905 [Sulfuriroseicoccus oceanibius]